MEFDFEFLYGDIAHLTFDQIRGRDAGFALNGAIGSQVDLFQTSKLAQSFFTYNSFWTKKKPYVHYIKDKLEWHWISRVDHVVV